MHKVSKAEVIKLPGSLVAQIVKNLPAKCRSPWFNSDQDDHLDRDKSYHSHLTL